ncbi:MAG TPA: sensor histidine kinase [Thermoanaerobaculia bacterium]
MQSAEGRSRFWLIYAAAWLPLAAIYALLIASRGMTLYDAIGGSLSSVVPAALLGAVVVRLTERIAAGDSGRARFLALHGALGLAYAAAWCGAIIGSMYWGAPRAIFDDFVRNAAGWQFVSGLMLYMLIAGITTALRSARRLREEQAAAVRSEALRVHAELQALRAQLNPHFLFNTLHTLIALVRRDPVKAEAALERFGDLLRYVLDVNRDLLDEVALADELAFVRSYLSLEQLRLSERLEVVEEIEGDALDCLMPSFTLQPLVENAIRHGIAPQARGGTLRIIAQLSGDRLLMEVTDDGVGAAADAVNGAEGLGLRAVRQRIEARYGDASSFVVTTTPGGGFAVRIAIPASAARHGTSRPAARDGQPALAR